MMIVVMVVRISSYLSMGSSRLLLIESLLNYCVMIMLLGVV